MIFKKNEIASHFQRVQKFRFQKGWKLPFRWQKRAKKGFSNSHREIFASLMPRRFDVLMELLRKREPHNPYSQPLAFLELSVFAVSIFLARNMGKKGTLNIMNSLLYKEGIRMLFSRGVQLFVVFSRIEGMRQSFKSCTCRCVL